MPLAKKSQNEVLTKLKDHARTIDLESGSVGAENSFFVADLGEIYRQHQRWIAHLPRVTPFYAVKCNTDFTLLRLLAKLGCNFDCASKGEIELVLRETGVTADRIIFAHPCKPPIAVRYAANKGIKQTTFDSEDELHKIKEHWPGAELYLRIVADDSDSTCKFSDKFGASGTSDLLKEAKRLELNVVGVSFHVGSGASDPTTFERSLRDARAAFDNACELGFDMHTLDLGGGFTSDNFDRAAEIINPLLDKMFPSNRIIAEPGRYYVTEAFTLACNVIARRQIEKSVFKLFINDGVYTNFLEFFVDKLPDPKPEVLLSTRARADSFTGSIGQEHTGETYDYSIWGQTADGIDRVTRVWHTKTLIETGDWLYFEDLGAYSLPSETRFNGFNDRCEVLYVCTETEAQELIDRT